MPSQLIGTESFREFLSFEELQSDLSQGHVDNLLPRVNIVGESRHSTTQLKNEASMAFIRNKDGHTSLWRKFLFTWRANGLQQAFEMLAQDDFSKMSPVSTVTHGLVAVWKAVKIVRKIVFSYSDDSYSADSIAVLCRTKDWANSPVRCLAWHPHCNKLAVATRDDTILVYAGATSVPVVARHSSQKDISSLAWRPMCSAQVAVGCATGVAIWTVDPASLGTRPSASCLTHLPHPTSVNTICWHPQGKYLASGSAKDSSLYIWNVENREATLLQKFRGGGFCFLSWSPSGDRLLAATPGSVFKIWETRYWSADNWDVMSGHVQAAAWSPCGTRVVFADSVQPTLYCLSVDPVPALGEKGHASFSSTSSRAATVIADFTETNQLSDDTKVGGLIQDIAWDARGERLAVLFRSTDSVALFRTRYTPAFSLFPCGILKGQPGEVASTMQFKPDFDNGALLTVAWSSGRVQHVAFSFIPQQIDS